MPPGAQSRANSYGLQNNRSKENLQNSQGEIYGNALAANRDLTLNFEAKYKTYDKRVDLTDRLRDQHTKSSSYLSSYIRG